MSFYLSHRRLIKISTPAIFHNPEDLAMWNSLRCIVFSYILVSPGRIPSRTPSVFATLDFSLRTEEYNRTILLLVLGHGCHYDADVLPQGASVLRFC